MLLPIFIMLMILSPVLLPAIITTAHFVLGTNRPASTFSHLRLAAA